MPRDTTERPSDLDDTRPLPVERRAVHPTTRRCCACGTVFLIDALRCPDCNLCYMDERTRRDLERAGFLRPPTKPTTP